MRRILLPLCITLICVVPGFAAKTKPLSESSTVAATAQNGPVTLEQSVKATLQHHRGLKVIQENRDVVTNELDRAKAGWGPRVDINARVGAGNLSDTTTRSLGSDKGMYGASSLGATLVQPLWDGYATRSRVRTAEHTVESVTNRIMDNATTLSLDAIIAHIDLIRRREIMRLADENVRRHDEILVASRDREQLGADSMAEVSQTEGRLARAKSTLSEAQASLREGENSYRRITGKPIPEELENVELPTPMYIHPDEVYTIAKEKNPKVLAYIQDVDAASGNVDLAKSANHPVINLEAGPSYTDRAGPGNQWTRGFDVMTTMRWNVFNNGADAAEVRASKARVRQSRQSLFDFMDTLDLEVNDTWTAYKAAQEQLQFYTEAIGYNTRTRDAYLEQFILGQRSLLDVLDAESELFNSCTQAATATGNILVGGWRLYALSGTLLPQFNIKQDELLIVPGD